MAPQASIAVAALLVCPSPLIIRRPVPVAAKRLGGFNMLASGADPDEEYLNSLSQQLRRAGKDIPDDVSPMNQGPGGYEQRLVVKRQRQQLLADLDSYLERPEQRLLLGSLALLVGFYVAGFLDMVYGQAGYWEYVSGFVALCVTEYISRACYCRPPRQRVMTLRLINAFKVGFYFGIALDALKAAG